jgi:O-antigen/teichoic acid export membrane protein
MIVAGCTIAVLGLPIATLLGGSDAAVLNYRLAFLACFISLAGAAHAAALQSRNLTYWNLTRVLQPLCFLGVAAVLLVNHSLTLSTAVAAFCVTILIRSCLSVLFARRENIRSGAARTELAKPMIKFGLSQLAASVPIALTARLDQLVLSVTSSAADLGHYAVAASLTALVVPVVAAAGHVSFPRIAARSLEPTNVLTIQRWAIVGTPRIGAGVITDRSPAPPQLHPAQ